MQGFFSKEDTRSLKVTSAKKASCFSCGLFKKCKSPKMEPQGDFKKQILIIGDGLTMKDDRRGKPFQGDEGEPLRKALEKFGIDMFRDCLVMNTAQCYTPKLTPLHTSICRDVKVLPALNEYKPNVTILLGTGAVQSLIGPRWKKNLGGIDKWRGWTIPDQDYKTWICPTLSPTLISKDEKKQKENQLIFERDLQNALMKYGQPVPEYEKPKIIYAEDLSFIKKIKSGTICAFDYEATGIKPQAKGHWTVCCAIAVSKNKVYVFELPKRKRELELFQNFLANQEIPKIAANMKYEDHWSKVILKTKVKNWDWDTMQAAHVLDHRPGITGLKFQTYVRLGLVDYDSHINKYLRSSKEDSEIYGANAMNKLLSFKSHDPEMKALLEYCALDSINEYRVAIDQKEEMNQKTLPL